VAQPVISIIGLGLTGTSVGLGLQRSPGDFEIVGHDKDPAAASTAKKAGAVNRTEWNLHRAYEEANLIVLALPLNELDGLLGHMREGLRPDAMILALTNIMQPAIEIADKQLPENVHFVAAHPIVTGIGGRLTPRADLFDDATFCLAPSLNTDPDAVQLASDFAERLGAKPFYVDAAEHDGIMAGVEQLPQLLAAALMRMSANSPSWSENKRMAGRPFAQATELGGNAQQLFAALQTNRDSLVYRIDQLQQELAEWKALLQLEVEADAEDAHPLLQQLEQAVDERAQWVASAELRQWDGAAAELDEIDSQPGFMRQLFLGGMFNRKSKE
jgi:prephenate dehydrogenase